MKEATGELSITAVAIVAIAAIGVVFTTLIWPAIKGGLLSSTKCSQAFACEGTGDMVTCKYYDEDGSVASETVQCPNKSTGK